MYQYSPGATPVRSQVIITPFSPLLVIPLTLFDAEYPPEEFKALTIANG